MRSSLIFLFHLVSVVVLLLCNGINNANSSGSSRIITSSTSSSRHRILAARDFSRYRTISHKVRATTSTTQMSSRSPPRPRHGRPGPAGSLLRRRRRRAAIKLRLYSAADFGIGEYVAEVELGTPPKKFKLLADTGSDLTWVKCRYRRRRHDEVHWKGHGVFEAEESSSSFKTVPCGSRECSEGLADLFSLVTCPRPSAPCLYNYSYQDDNLLTAFGVFGEEISTLPLTWARERTRERDRPWASHEPTTTSSTGTVLRLPTILGCTESTTRGSSSSSSIDILAEADGVLGLSYNTKSLGYRAATSSYGAGQFSYCLVDHLSTANVTSYLVFGSTNHQQLLTKQTNCLVRPQRTKLVLGAIGDLYAVRVKGISVDGYMLDNIPPRVWDGTIIDSGTSLTMLATPAYEALMKAMRRALEPRFPNIGSTEDIEPFSYCFKFNFKYKYNSSSSSTTTDEDYSRAAQLPRLVVHFEDGARFEPHVKSYLVDDRPGVKCVGVLDAGGGGDDQAQTQAPPYMSIIGNILQQNFFWEFDLFRHHLRFGPSTCT